MLYEIIFHLQRRTERAAIVYRSKILYVLTVDRGSSYRGGIAFGFGQDTGGSDFEEGL